MPSVVGTENPQFLHTGSTVTLSNKPRPSRHAEHRDVKAESSPKPRICTFISPVWAAPDLMLDKKKPTVSEDALKKGAEQAGVEFRSRFFSTLVLSFSSQLLDSLHKKRQNSRSKSPRRTCLCYSFQ
ncbi:hypothetical protein H2248_000429 [Termitomyces sp. 'cryptogamus']|nr:hypothetical protein H2248_000429 [Termitomyces sp. 'cryptogamus']